MLLLSVLALAFVLPTVVNGRIPVVDGVIGGVRSSDLSTVKTLKDAVDADATARTPGKLRVVENSGVCGKCGLFTSTGHCRVNIFGRNYITCLSGVRIWRHRCEREHLVCVALRASLSIFVNISSKGSGFLLHATILTLLPSSHGSMAV